MVREQIVRVRRLLTLHLVGIAFLTATLVAVGSNGVFLPLLVFMVGVSSLLFVDWFEWFSLHHVLAYFGMILGTIFALTDYFLWAGADANRQLCSIASLLIYPELVIMLQRKNMRLFEQMAIFLLLEIIVAALINNNVLFGVLLAPIVLLWVASLLLFTRYASLIQLAPDLDKPTPRVIELIADAWKRARQRVKPGSPKMVRVIQPTDARMTVAGHWTLFAQSIGIGIVSLVFAGLYFYLLPRTAVDMESFSMAPRTGLGESMTLGSIGRLLLDKTPVMRVSLRDAQTNKPYRLNEPPYIRVTVVSRYFRNNSTVTSFESTDQVVGPTGDTFEPFNTFRLPSSSTSADNVVAEFNLLSPDGSMLPCIPPMANYDRQKNFMSLLPFEWRLINNRSDQFPGKTKPRYELITTAFESGNEIPVLVDARQHLNRPSRNVHARLIYALSKLRVERGEYYDRRWIDTLLEKVYARSPNAQTPIQMAWAVESYLSSSGDFTYSLAPRATPRSDLDPIEDFVLNQKRGHCQYFAAALTMTLRRLNIPTRIVMGYHPLEYNELGEYFSVRRSDAHAWVEAYFDADTLKAEGLYRPEFGQHGGWLRLDPTPAGAGSNAGNELRTQADQSMDYVNKFWSEYVLNGRQRAEENSLYRPLQESTRQTWQRLMDSGRELIKWARENEFVGGAINRENWFSWPVAVMIMLLGGALVFLWRLIRWLPRWAPQLAKKLGLRPSAEEVNQQFFKHCMRLLNRAGFVKRSSQTAAEYTSAAGESLASAQRWDTAPSQLDLLTRSYYQVRFGANNILPPAIQKEILSTLEDMERKLR